MKACPGLRSGIHLSGSLSFAIRDFPSSIRPLIRHSSESWHPEGWGGVRRSDDEKTARRITIFIPLCDLAKSIGHSVGTGWATAILDPETPSFLETRTSAAG